MPGRALGGAGSGGEGEAAGGAGLASAGRARAAAGKAAAQGRRAQAGTSAVAAGAAPMRAGVARSLVLFSLLVSCGTCVARRALRDADQRSEVFPASAGVGATRCPASFRACGPFGVDAGSLPDLLFRSAGRVAPIEPVDLANSDEALQAVARARSYRGELIVFAATANHWPYAVNVVKQLEDIGMEHYIFIAPTRADCDALRDKRPGLACAYSTLITGATGPTASMAESATFTVWTTRKRLVGRWAELGLGVLQADLDVIFYDNPYPALKGVLRNVSLVHLQEGRCNEAKANGGLLYAQHACSGSVAHWVLREVYERVRRNLEDPRTMNMYYPDLIGDETDLNREATRRHVVVRTSDEQDSLRDCLLSAFTGKDLHLYGARATAWEKFGREHWLKRYRDEVGDYNCDAVELDSEALPGVCYIPSREGVHPRALVHSLTAHRAARANTDAAEGDVLCGGGEADGLVEYGGFAPYELFGGIGLAMGQHTRARDCAVGEAAWPAELWGRVRVAPASIVHLVGASHPGRGVIMRVSGAWDHERIDGQLVEGVDTAVPAARRRRALALAYPLVASSIPSRAAFDELLQSLLMVADAADRMMAAPVTICEKSRVNVRDKWWTGQTTTFQMPVGEGQAQGSASLSQPPHVAEPIRRVCVWAMYANPGCKEWEFLHAPDLDRLATETGGVAAVKKVKLADLLVDGYVGAASGGDTVTWEARTWRRYAGTPSANANYAFDAEKVRAQVDALLTCTRSHAPASSGALTIPRVATHLNGADYSTPWRLRGHCDNRHWRGRGPALGRRQRGSPVEH